MPTTTPPALLHRFVSLPATAAKGDTFSLSFSSEAPVQRTYGQEVLSHAPGAVDLSRLNGGVAPFLWNHDPGSVLGVVERAQIGGGKGRAVIRWGTSPLAQQYRADVEAGILSAVSVGYQIDKSERRGDTITATKWTPYEISLVAIPADGDVGIGRSFAGLGSSDNGRVTSQAHPREMTEANTATQHASPAELEQQIANLGDLMTRRFGDLQRQLQHPAQPVRTSGDLPFTGQEQRRYSLIKAIHAAATGDWSAAGFERECSRALEQQTGQQARGFLLPQNLQMRANYNVGTASAGGNLVATDLLADQFIDALRNRLVIAELGCTYLPGLQGNVAIPRRATLSSTYWVAESTAITASGGTVDQVTMSPKTVGALSSWSRIAGLQATPELERLIRNDMVAQVAAAIDLAAINGSGANSQPRGILNTSGIGSVVGGTNGATISFDHLADLKREVAIDNADVEGGAFLTNSKVEAKLLKLVSSGGGDYFYGPTAGTPATVWGRKFAVSNLVPGTLTKGTAAGTASAVIYGNFNDLLIGLWGTTDVLVNPFGSGFSAGDVEIRIMQTCDIAVRHAESFAAMSDALTA
jgi:HK97 family phage major capsid protein/HK97 family phage prohead protease